MSWLYGKHPITEPTWIAVYCDNELCRERPVGYMTKCRVSCFGGNNIEFEWYYLRTPNNWMCPKSPSEPVEFATSRMSIDAIVVVSAEVSNKYVNF